MEIIGLIAEYNPFHNGHLYQINKIKELYQDSIIILILNIIPPATITSKVTISPRITAIVLENLCLSFLLILCVVFTAFIILLLLHVRQIKIALILWSIMPEHIFRTYILFLLIYNNIPISKMEEFSEHLFAVFSL